MVNWRSWRTLQLDECQGESRRRCSRVLATMAALHLHDHVFLAERVGSTGTEAVVAWRNSANALHSATSHGAAPVPSDTATSSFYQHPDPPYTNIFQHEPWYPVIDQAALDSVPPGINPLTGAVFNPHADLPPPFYLHGIRSGWRAVTPPTDTDSDSEW